MRIADIKPFIRHVSQYVINNNVLEEENLVSYDYCMLYIVSGNGNIIINNTLYKIEKGCVLLWEPGAVYSFSGQSKNATYILVHFDYISEGNVGKIYPMRSVPLEQLKKSKVMKKVNFTDESHFNDTVFIKDMQILEERFYNILTEYKRCEKYFEIKISGIMTSVLADIARNIDLLGKVNVKRDKVSEILSYINENYNEPINNKVIGDKFSFHPQYINELVKSRTGYTLHQYILTRRISKAIYFLQTSDIPIVEIADKVGFQDAAHFSKSFKQIMGVSPKEYREKSRIEM